MQRLRQHPNVIGFYHVPITMIIFGISGILSLYSNFGDPALFRLFDLGQFGKMIKVFTSQWIYESKMDVAIGSYLLYEMRFIERQFGSRKFASFAVMVLLLVGLLRTLVEYSMQKQPNESHPFGFISACMIVYYRNIPAIVNRRSNSHAFVISQKMPVYFTYLLAASNAVVPCMLGFVAGFLALDSGLKTWRIPNAVVSVCKTLEPLVTLDSPSEVQSRRRANRNAQQNAARAPGRDQLMPGNGTAGNITPRPELVEQLVALGFSQDDAMNALRTFNNNLEQAANQLLNRN